MLLCSLAFLRGGLSHSPSVLGMLGWRGGCWGVRRPSFQALPSSGYRPEGRLWRWAMGVWVALEASWRIAMSCASTRSQLRVGALVAGVSGRAPGNVWVGPKARRRCFIGLWWCWLWCMLWRVVWRSLGGRALQAAFLGERWFGDGAVLHETGVVIVGVLVIRSLVGVGRW